MRGRPAATDADANDPVFQCLPAARHPGDLPTQRDHSIVSTIFPKCLLARIIASASAT